MAGALGLKRDGPRRYGDACVEDHWMGEPDGRAAADAGDIRRALRLYVVACGLLVVRLVVERGLSVGQVLAVTFTEAATQELRKRKIGRASCRERVCQSV